MNSTQLRQMIVEGLRNQVTHHCGMFIRNPANVGVREQLEKMIAVLAFTERVAKEPAHFMSWGMVPIGKTVSALHVAMDRIADASNDKQVQAAMDYAAEWAMPKPLDAETAASIRREGTLPMGAMRDPGDNRPREGLPPGAGLTAPRKPPTPRETTREESRGNPVPSTAERARDLPEG